MLTLIVSQVCKKKKGHPRKQAHREMTVIMLFFFLFFDFLEFMMLHCPQPIMLFLSQSSSLCKPHKVLSKEISYLFLVGPMWRAGMERGQEEQSKGRSSEITTQRNHLGT